MDFSERKFSLYVEVFGDFDEEMSGNKVLGRLEQAVEQEDHAATGKEEGAKGVRQLRLCQELNLITESLPPLITKNWLQPDSNPGPKVTNMTP